MPTQMDDRQSDLTEPERVAVTQSPIRGDGQGISVGVACGSGGMR